VLDLDNTDLDAVDDDGDWTDWAENLLISIDQLNVSILEEPFVRQLFVFVHGHAVQVVEPLGRGGRKVRNTCAGSRG